MKRFFITLAILSLCLVACNEGMDIPKLTPTPTVEFSTDVVFTAEQLKLPAKKGACLTLKESGQAGSYAENMPKVSSLNVSWNYSWGSKLAPNQLPNVEFVPMTWGKFDPTTAYNSLIPEVVSGNFKRILSFNEPDGAEQANMTVEQAIQLWPTLEKLGIPIGSPAAVNPLGEWMDDFMSEVDRLGYRVDYICVHNYGGTNVSSFKSRMTEIYNKWKKPLILTEFAPADWNAKTPEENRLTDEAVLNFMKGVLPWMEETEWIYGYAWFPFGQDSAPGCRSALFDKDGNLTKLGKYYAAYDPNKENQDPGTEPDPGTGNDPTPETDNLLKNPGFEDGKVDWTFYQWNCNLDDSEANPDIAANIISGKKQVRFTGNSYSEVKQDINVEEGKTYEFGFTGRVQKTGGPEGTEANANAHLTMVARPGGDKALQVTVQLKGINMNTTVSNRITVPAGQTSMTILVWKQPGICYLDDVFVKEVKE